jgi:predicted RNA polymerase sigma factor
MDDFNELQKAAVSHIQQAMVELNRALAIASGAGLEVNLDSIDARSIDGPATRRIYQATIRRAGEITV